MSRRFEFFGENIFPLRWTPVDVHGKKAAKTVSRGTGTLKSRPTPRPCSPWDARVALSRRPVLLALVRPSVSLKSGPILACNRSMIDVTVTRTNTAIYVMIQREHLEDFRLEDFGDQLHLGLFFKLSSQLNSDQISVIYIWLNSS